MHCKYFADQPLRKGGQLKNYDSKHVKKNPVRNSLAPETPSRILLCGPSGCGKTNLLLNLIYDLLPWSRLYVFAKDLYEDKYCQLRHNCEAVKSIDERFQFTFDSSEIVHVDDLDPSEHNLMIFDDFVCDRQSLAKISELFIRGRKKNATLVFLTQSYFNTPKLIRLQCNYFCIWNLHDDRELCEIHRNHSFGLRKRDFMEIFQEATADPHSFLFLDTIHKDPTYRIRKTFNQPLLVADRNIKK